MFRELLSDPAMAFLLLSGGISGLVNVIKAILDVEKEKNEWKKKFIPAISVAIGIFVSWVVFGYEVSNTMFLVGGAFGLSAVGLFEGTKILMPKKKSEK